LIVTNLISHIHYRHQHAPSHVYQFVSAFDHPHWLLCCCLLLLLLLLQPHSALPVSGFLRSLAGVGRQPLHVQQGWAFRLDRQ